MYKRQVFLVEEGQRLVQYRLTGRDLTRAWTFEVQTPCSAARIHAGEIYLATKKGLMRLRTGRPRPVWQADGECVGEPAVFGDHVLVMRKASGGDLELALHARTSGEVVLTHPLGVGAPKGTGGRIAMSDKTIALLVPPVADGKWVLLRRKYDKDKKTVTLESHGDRVL